MRTIGKILLLLSVLFSMPVYSGELSSRMVSTGWLRSNISKENVRIIDVRKINLYYNSHIPNAVYLNPESVRLSINGVPYLPISSNALSSLLGEIGISEKSTVIIYGNQEDVQTFYLIWLFDYIGHKDVALLEGGFEKWESENRPVSQDLPEITAVPYQMPSRMIDDIRVNKKDVLKSVQNSAVIILDVESPETYAGLIGNCKRFGHIKGAVNHFWRNDVENGYQWKSIDALKRAYGKLGIQNNKKIILVCQDGWSAAHSYFTLRYIVRYPLVQLYDGGMGEWASSDLPMEISDPEIEIETSSTNF